ncbi:hypothetical protein LTR50_005292 [Elasticomyces elasticus]|nr:hypothetical protein LTR50_005292 [Elasticomyces elasticus]
MTDSPAVRLPLDPAEQPILDRVLEIRDHLSLLKQDRSTYVRAQDVTALYNQIIEQVEQLNHIRAIGKKREEQNRGRNQEAPAVYSAISTVKRLLDHLREAGFYSAKDLESISKKLVEWQQSVERGKESHSPQLMTLLEARIDVCRATLYELQHYLSSLDQASMGTYEKLVSILRSLSACNTKSKVGVPLQELASPPARHVTALTNAKYPAAEVNAFQEQLLAMQAELHETNVRNEDRTAEEDYADRLSQLNIKESSNAEGPKVVSALLARCLLWVEIVQEKKGTIDPRFKGTYDKLLKIRNALDAMNITQAWSLRETDLYSYQRQLDRVDESRVDGNFIDDEGRPADLHAQRTLLYLLRKSYAYIYQYIVNSEPVSEALLPIYNQLLTLRRCLVEVKRAGGVDSPRELYPYSMKLNSIDNMRKDGKFMVGDDIPEGQGAITSLLSECFDLAYELRTSAEEKDEEDKETMPEPTPLEEKEARINDAIMGVEDQQERDGIVPGEEPRLGGYGTVGVNGNGSPAT